VKTLEVSLGKADLRWAQGLASEQPTP
jgi:hypothetical protein